MEYLERIRQLYSDYLTQVEKLEAERKIGEGLLGFGAGPADNPCHDEFAASLKSELEEISRQNANSEQLQPVLAYIYQIPLEYQSLKTAYWMLLAVQGLTIDLISQLSPAAAESLWADYAETYPRWERLPAQKKVLKALDSARKAKRRD